MLREQRGARVLLVEDHPLNRDVAGALLRAAGLEVDLAENGQIACDMAQAGGHDLILMDLRMPVMGGLEAARRIRTNPRLARVPIIGMTGNALDEDRAACLAAGMNDQVSKPVSPRVLYSTIARWLTDAPRGDAAGGTPDRSPATPPSATPRGTLPPIAGLDTTRGLALFAGSDAAYLHALRTCIALYGGGLPLLEARLAGRPDVSVEALHAEVHAVGGGCAAIGAVDIERQVQAIEKLLGDANLGVDDARMLRMLEGLRSSLAALVRQLHDKLPPIE